MPASTIPKTRPRLVTVNPSTVGHWSHQLGTHVIAASRVDRRHGDALNDIRARMNAITCHNGPVQIGLADVMIWAGTVMLVASKIGAHDLATAIHDIGNEIAEFAGNAVSS